MINYQAEIEKWFSQTNYSVLTQKRYARAIKKVREAFPDLEKLDGPTFKNWLNETGWKMSNQWVHMMAVKVFVRWKFGDYHPVLLVRLPRPRYPKYRTLSFEEAETLMNSYNRRTIKGRRDLAICSLFLDTGLRVSEMCRLEIQHLDLAGRNLSVIIKGGDWGEGVFSEETAEYIADWLTDREDIAKPGVRTVFVSVGGQTPGNRFHRHGLQRIVKHWGQEAGLGHISPHCFRRTYAYLATLLKSPERITMANGRWKDRDTFGRYVREIKPSDFDPFSPVRAIRNGHFRNGNH